jgi:hypothetical protein
LLEGGSLGTWELGARKLRHDTEGRTGAFEATA